MIELKDVTKYYSSDTSVAMALRNINLEFHKGEFVVITGKSGSGKSTLLNVISGMDTYEEGEMYFNGMETSYYDKKDWEDYRRENISFIYQSYNLIDSYTALENVETVMRIENGKESRRERKKRALEILDQVGLKKRARHKAVHLSSGQKQRLGIARALAKDTDIIIADEPTGNLDVENGVAVMKMLYELSRDKLVIVVTHNFEQVQDFATRKIRLFDGEVAEDILLNPQQERKEETGQKTTEKKKTEKKHGEWFQAVGFVHKNRMAQPHRSIFLFLLLLVITSSLMIMYGYLLANMDDSVTRDTRQGAFNNTQKERLVVRKPDGSTFSDSDIEVLQKNAHVKYVSRYDFAGEISCLYKSGEDYKIEYKKSETSDRKSLTVDALDYSEFTEEAAGLDESSIEGKLPENMYEAVITSKDSSLIGTQMDIYFKSKKWSDATWLGGTFTITGIVKEDGNKPYFSGEFLKSMNINYGDSRTELHYDITRTTMYSGEEENSYEQTMSKKGKVIFIQGEGLTGNQIRLSESILMNIRTDGVVSGDQTIRESLNKDAVLKYSDGTGEDTEYSLEIVEGSHSGSASVVETSHEFLEQLYGSTEITQVSVYMNDYAYTDRVIKEINQSGYQAVSPYRISAGDYNTELVQERLTALGLSAAVLIAVFFLSIMVLYAIMKLKTKDFKILKSLGLKQSVINRMNLYELATAGLAAVLVLILAGVTADRMNVRVISDIIRYYTARDYVLAMVAVLILAIITAAWFNRYLGKILGGKR
ncbi:MAG: ATP-binding cassette domain-containing protein [Lachnospiraceae bacterium]